MATLKDSSLAINWRHISAVPRPYFWLDLFARSGFFLRGGLDTPGRSLSFTADAAARLQRHRAGLFFFPESPIYHGKACRAGTLVSTTTSWFLTVIYALGALGVWLAPAQGTLALAAAIPQLLALPWAARAHRAPLCSRAASRWPGSG